jgi:FkbM family methyltransferase
MAASRKVITRLVGANSFLRRVVKAGLHPVLNEHTYVYLQAIAKALDIRRGKWYEPEIDLIALAVRAGDAALDIGANYGVYAYHLSRAVGPAGHVYSFEPVPFTHRTLSLIARLLRLGNVTIVPKGCSDSNGTIEFAVPIQHSGAPSAGQAHIGKRNDDRSGRESQVRWNESTRVRCDVVALDAYLPPLRNLSLIKCDIEGAELLAFRGAARTIESHHPCVICEINPWFLEGFGLRLEELTGFFADRGYGLYRYTPEKRLRKIVSLDDVVEDNYVFLHPDRAGPFAGLLESA